MKTPKKPLIYTGKQRLYFDELSGCVSDSSFKLKGDGSIASTKGGK